MPSSSVEIIGAIAWASLAASASTPDKGDDEADHGADQADQDDRVGQMADAAQPHGETHLQ